MSDEVPADGEGGCPDSLRGRNLFAMGSLVASLLLLIAYHFLPVDLGEDRERGWTIWKDIWDVLRYPEGLVNSPIAAVALVFFFTFVALVVAAPFLVGFFQKSPHYRYWAALFSAVVSLFSLRNLTVLGEADFVLGEICLMASPFLNLIGLLIIRAEREPVLNAPREKR